MNEIEKERYNNNLLDKKVMIGTEFDKVVLQVAIRS